MVHMAFQWSVLGCAIPIPSSLRLRVLHVSLARALFEAFVLLSRISALELLVAIFSRTGAGAPALKRKLLEGSCWIYHDCCREPLLDKYEGKMGTVAGWGLLKEGGSRPTVLMELTMKIWNNDKCRTTYGSTAPAGIKSSMLCAGKQGKDSCSGDSGGPFVAPVGDHWEQIGVVSWGIGCGKQHYPGVYTRVSEMMDWIDKVRKLYPN